jgi:hypothetical protein
MAVGGVLLLCVLALIVTLSDYTSHPAVAVAHVPPVVGTPTSDTSSQAPSPMPTMPVATDLPTPGEPTPQAQRVRSQLTLAQWLQQLEQRRHHRPPQG